MTSGLGVHSIDLDERRNRVAVGISEDADVTSLLGELNEVGIPAAAVLFDREGPIEPAHHDLISEADTITGGWRMRATGQGGCTIGPLAELGFGSGSWGFLTNSHCSESFLDLDFGFAYQPSDQLLEWRIGQEVLDPDPLPDDTCVYYGVKNSDACRWSDASWYEYNSTRHFGFGLIARTLPGSTSIDHNEWYFRVRGEVSAPLVGETVHKVGSKSGWTSGEVTKTCRHSIFGATDIVFLCQDKAALHFENGDSGSPVFIQGSQEDIVYVVGMGWGFTSTEMAFSSVWNLETDFGDNRLAPDAGPGMDFHFGPGLY